MAISFRARVSVPSRVLLQRLGEESVLLDLQSESYFGLDPVGTRMWEALTKTKDVEAAYQQLLSTYDIDARHLRQDLEGLIDKLVANGLLEIKNE